MRVLVAFAMLLTVSLAHAEERILNYDVRVAIQQDGALEVTEHITVRAEGSNIRRGIYRDFPTRYRDRYGNRVVVDLEVLSVERDGQPEPWFTENVANGVRINTGDDDFLPTPGEFTFTLRYRTTRQLGFFADHDELYWNAIGTGWVFPIETATVEATLPERVPAEQLSAEGYTGPQGAQGADYLADVGDGVARWRVTRPLQPYEGFTIVLSFPKGLIAQPSGAQRAWWLFKDNLGVLVAAAGLVLLIFYCVREWRRVGRDPAQGVIIARYEPPEGHTPAALRYMQRTSYDTRCFSSDLLALAVAGCVRIERDKGFFKDDWSVERIDAKVMPDSQQTLLARLFQKEQKLEFKKANATTLAAATSAHAKSLERALQPRYFNRNSLSFFKALGIAVAAIVAGFMIAAGTSAIALIVIGALMALTLVVFANVVRAPTKEGRALLDQIAGLKLYMSVAERDELARMQEPDAPPQLDAQRYQHLLPYAVALEVEEAWTDKFTAAVGAAAAAEASRNIGWYRGGDVSDFGSLSRALGGSLTSQIASSSTPPGSSSGRGGGSSGGGGGGGGGGGR